jgi:hypothetical protein
VKVNTKVSGLFKSQYWVNKIEDENHSYTYNVLDQKLATALNTNSHHIRCITKE